MKYHVKYVLFGLNKAEVWFSVKPDGTLGDHYTSKKEQYQSRNVLELDAILNYREGWNNCMDQVVKDSGG